MTALDSVGAGLEGSRLPSSGTAPPKGRAGRARRLGLRIAALFPLAVLLAWLGYVLPMWGIPFQASRLTRVPLTPRWALGCWLWEDDINTADAIMGLVDGYRRYDVPVKTVLIDSPWSVRYNDFRADEDRYPHPGELIAKLHGEGYRVLFWMTPIVNSSNSDTSTKDAREWFTRAKKDGYLVGGGQELDWWKGRGALIDYTSPNAMKWWHGLQEQMLSWGIDGWKLDDTAKYFGYHIGRFQIPYQSASVGWMTTRGYMDRYYRDEYRYGLSRSPEFVTLSRSFTGYMAQWEGFSPLDSSPVNWVGDQRQHWSMGDQGLEEAISYILRSADLGYNVVGSDVGGYDGELIPPRLFMRWAELSAFCGLFLNGGHSERALWKRTPEELEVFRKFSWLHTELVPYIYSYAARCHRGERPLMVAVEGKYQYLFGNELLVAPIYTDSLDRQVKLPKGRWRYLFDDAKVLEGPATFTRSFPLDEFPVYVRDGAIIPMEVTRAYTGFGDQKSEGHATFAIYPNGHSSFSLLEGALQGGGATSIEVDDGSEIRIRFSNPCGPRILRVALDKRPRSVKLDGQDLLEDAWHFDAQHGRLWVTDDSGAGLSFAIVRDRAGA